MRLAFMGTPAFALVALRALHSAGHTVAAVYSQPPRPAGRGRKPRPSPVHAWAEDQGLAVRTPISLKDANGQTAFAALDLDVAVVAAYGLILPQPVLDAPRQGCLNIHASLLPRWRGAAPIQHAILAGDTETGVTIMQMEAGLDTGPVLLREAVAIGPTATGGALHDVLAAHGADMIVRALARLDTLVAEPQPSDGATYAAKIEKGDARLNWSRPAAAIDRQVRAFTPVPGAWFTLPGGVHLRVLSGGIKAATGAAGTVLDDALTIACATDAYRPALVRPAGKTTMTSSDFLRGHPSIRGKMLE